MPLTQHLQNRIVELDSTENLELSFTYNDDSNGYISPDIIDSHDNAVWNSKKGDVPMRDMDGQFLQRAFEDVLYAELKLMKQLEELERIKCHLLHEASLKKTRLMWLDELRNKSFNNIFKSERAVRKIIDFSLLKSSHYRELNREKFRKGYQPVIFESGDVVPVDKINFVNLES